MKFPALLPAPRQGGFRDPDYWIWGASCIRSADGIYHLFASRWSKEVDFGHWVTRSEIVHAVSETAEGPYEYQGTVLPPRGERFWDGLCTHNPAIRCWQGKYLLFYTGMTYPGGLPTKENPALWGGQRALDAWRNKRIGLAVADSPNGPWQRMDEPILEVRPEKWDAALISNAAPWVMPDGSIYLIYKSSRHGQNDKGQLIGQFELGLARSDGWKKPFERVTDEPILSFPETGDLAGAHVEDPFLWHDGEKFCLLAKDMTGQITGQMGAGTLLVSPGAVDWKLARNPMAYPRTEIQWDDGTITCPGNLERPQLLIQDGRPTHLFLATSDASGVWDMKHTWNMVIPLKT